MCSSRGKEQAEGGRVLFWRRGHGLWVLMASLKGKHLEAFLCALLERTLRAKDAHALPEGRDRDMGGQCLPRGRSARLSVSVYPL